MFRYFVTIPVITICLLVVLVSVVLILELQVNIKEIINNKSKIKKKIISEIKSKYLLFSNFFFQQWWDIVIKERGYFSFLSFLPKVLLAIIIPILDNIYNEIALWLNDMGKTENSFTNFPN